jgi:integrase
MSVEKTPAGTYEVRWRIRDALGKWIQQQKTFGKCKAAEDFDKKVHTQVTEGEYIPESRLTVKDITEQWLEARRPKWKIQTYLSAKGHAENYVIPRLGHLKATSVRFVDIESAGAEWGEKISAETVNKIYADINRVYKFARKLGVKVNPMADVEKLAKGVSPEELEAQALEAIGAIPDYVPDHGEDAPEGKANHLRAIGSDEVYSALELRKVIGVSLPGLERALLMTEILEGLRHGELNGLRKSVVDLKKGTLFINRSLTQLKGGPILERPKTKAAYRVLKMPPELVSELRHWMLQCPPSPNGFLFCDELGRPMNRKANNKALKACCKRAGVRVLSMNNLRHSFASQHLMAGTKVLEVSKMMGHSDPGVTLKVYSRWAETEKSTSEIALANRILGAEGAEETAQATGSE